MLFDIEKQQVQRWYIDMHEVCAGCPYLGAVRDERVFCIMRQSPPECIIAKIAGRFERTDETGEN